VRAQDRARGGREASHPVEVVLQRGVFEHRYGQRQVLAQYVPPLRAYVLQRQVAYVGRDSLHTVVYDRALDRLDVDVSFLFHEMDCAERAASTTRTHMDASPTVKR
jgi:hypothetical protein